MKTPEQMAEEYIAGLESQQKCCYNQSYGVGALESGFLAGYQAAKDEVNSSNNSNGSASSCDMSSYLSDSYLEIARDGAEREVRKRKNGEWTEWSAEANVLLALLNERKERTNLPTPAKWISVEDRLPEKHTPANSILAWGISRKREYLWAEKQKSPYPFGPDRFIACYTENTGFLDDGFAPCNVTHWMPLPSAEGLKHED